MPRVKGIGWMRLFEAALASQCQVWGGHANIVLPLTADMTDQRLFWELVDRFDASHNVFWKLHYARLYDIVLATPLGVRDVAVGEVTWALIRGGVYAATFMIVALVAGVVMSWWAVLALPAACRFVRQLLAEVDGGRAHTPPARTP